MTKQPQPEQLKHAENLEALKRWLAEQMSNAVLRDDHPTLQELSEMVKLTSQLQHRLNAPHDSASQSVRVSMPDSSGPRQEEYPRFRYDDQQLIKTARSRNGSVYEHAVSRDTYRKILARLKRLAEERNAFTSEQVGSVKKELACPPYQMYAVLAFLRRQELLLSERKGRYRFSPNFVSEAEQAWPIDSGD